MTDFGVANVEFVRRRGPAGWERTSQAHTHTSARFRFKIPTTDHGMVVRYPFSPSPWFSLPRPVAPSWALFKRRLYILTNDDDDEYSFSRVGGRRSELGIIGDEEDIKLVYFVDLLNAECTKVQGTSLPRSTP